VRAAEEGEAGAGAMARNDAVKKVLASWQSFLGELSAGGKSRACEAYVRLLEAELENAKAAARGSSGEADAHDCAHDCAGPSAGGRNEGEDGANRKKRSRKVFSTIATFETRDDAVAFLREELEQKQKGSYVRVNSSKSYQGGPLGAVFGCRLHRECTYSLRLFFSRQTQKWHLSEGGAHADALNILAKKISPALMHAFLSLMKQVGKEGDNSMELAARCIKTLRERSEKDGNKEMLAMLDNPRRICSHN